SCHSKSPPHIYPDVLWSETEERGKSSCSLSSAPGFLSLILRRSQRSPVFSRSLPPARDAPDLPYIKAAPRSGSALPESPVLLSAWYPGSVSSPGQNWFSLHP